MITIKHYLSLTKPRIIIGNLTSSIGGFLIASKGYINYIMLINMIIGTSLIIAASCVLNNVIDRDIDAIMTRTKNRVLPQKIFSSKKSMYYALILGILGLLFLGYIKNLLVIFLTIIGFLVYVVIYSLWMKRTSIYSIIIGSISGSMPPIIGYCTVTNQIDTGALILLMIFSFWQIPHSYSIIMFQLNDYKKAKIPTFAVKNGIKSTRIHMIMYIIGFIISIFALAKYNYISYTVLYIITIISLLWLYTGLFEYPSITDNIAWSKKMFIWSVVVIICFNLLISLDSLLFTENSNQNT